MKKKIKVMKSGSFSENLKKQLDSVKDIEGFPRAEVDDILYLSEPPSYTACPNPFIKDFIKKYGNPYDSINDTYKRDPFIKDIREGKHHPIYLAHTYHTKVPHQAVQKFIEYYTNPGDIIFDGFCGTGMVGIAATLSNREAIISEISPFATFIANNFLNSLYPEEFMKIFEEILCDVREECDWMYKTNHTNKAINTRTKKYANYIKAFEKIGKINYIVWNDVYECPYCYNEICFGETPNERKPGEKYDQFNCPYCDSIVNERKAKKVMFQKYDDILNDSIDVVKDKPILISYSVGKSNFWKKPDEFDFHLIEKTEGINIPYWIPNKRMPKGRSTTQALKSHNITYVHQYFTKRNLYVICKFLDLCKKRNFKIWFLISSLLQKASKLMALNKDYIGRVTKGTLYVSSTRQEINIFYFLNKNIASFKQSLEILKHSKKFIISTQSATDLSNIPSNSIDYIFTDPPFGGNIMYSELNFIWEAFLRVFTNNEHEAIENKVQGKSLQDYTKLMERCFVEMFRILKPNRWITIEFHNSKASVWNSIQTAIKNAGFVISLVSVLDKKVGSFKQITTANSVKNDLIINAFKPKNETPSQILKSADLSLDIQFLREQLKSLPIQPMVSRTDKMLFSKMLAHYIENGFEITSNSTGFYKILNENFVELDGYWFIREQIQIYKKLKAEIRDN